LNWMCCHCFLNLLTKAWKTNLDISGIERHEW
jgi:hypothetical protein